MSYSDVMEIDYAMDEEERDALKNLIVYFGCTVPHLQEVKLNKLIYIAHLYHYSNHGQLLTKTPFLSFSYGPHAPAIRSVINEQLESSAIYLEISRTETDPPYSNPCIIIRSCELKDEKLSDPCLNTMKKVVKDWGNKTFRQVLDYTTRTIPFISTTYRDHIDLIGIQPSRGLEGALSLPERIRLHRFVQTPEEAVGQASGYSSESYPVSINEVAEIYLALCGDLPEKIPSREHLGFNVQAILEAFATVNNKNENGTEKHLTDIDKAAQLSDSLLNSRSFRHYNDEVVLRSGMLFLKRYGYSFDREVLEENPPEGHDYETLREWFGRVSVKLDAGFSNSLSQCGSQSGK